MPNGRKLVAQIDGGTGHSGRRSPEIHFGLGKWEHSKLVPVEIKWRNTEGKVQQSAVQLAPGWHTVRLDLGALVQDRAIDGHLADVAGRSGASADGALHSLQDQSHL
jgi:hypothetical protein